MYSGMVGQMSPGGLLNKSHPPTPRAGVGLEVGLRKRGAYDHLFRKNPPWRGQSEAVSVLLYHPLPSWLSGVHTYTPPRIRAGGEEGKTNHNWPGMVFNQSTLTLSSQPGHVNGEVGMAYRITPFYIYPYQ